MDSNVCTRCGACVRCCPAWSLTRGRELAPADLVGALEGQLEQGGALDAALGDWLGGCFECFRCEAVCRVGARPLRRVEQAKRTLEPPIPVADGLDPASAAQRALAALSDLERQRLTTPRIVDGAALAFFPGCNAYADPELVTLMLALLDRVGQPCSFLPGLTSCCGDPGYFAGERQLGQSLGGSLLRAARDAGAETLLLWCPTCLCRLTVEGPPGALKLRSLLDFLVDNVGSLGLRPITPARKVTLHEPCKTAYTGLDVESHRRLLAAIPGLELREMPRHGKQTVCCGSGGYLRNADSTATLARDRLREAVDTRAEELITVCHYCSEGLARGGEAPLPVTNIIRLLARSADVV
jgi:heterodisulfide reductase subunit D